MNQDITYNGFKDLNCWKEARVLRMQLSQLVKSFPLTEKYSLTPQVTKAARSITTNIAEGYGQSSYKETRNYFVIARGAIAEIVDYLTVATDEKYIEEDILHVLEWQCELVFKLLNSYIAYLDAEIIPARMPAVNPINH